MEKKQPIRVAIVGSGMAGLVTAYLLHRDPRQRYAVKLFESGNSLSLDSASISVPNAHRTPAARIDLPMRAFAGGYYNNLKHMYDFLGISYHSQRFLFEFAKARSESTSRNTRESSYFIHPSNLHRLPPPRPSAVATVSHFIEVVYLLACYAWFSVCCFFIPPRTVSHDSSGAVSESLGQYLKRILLPEYFVSYYLLPLISSVTTCPHQALLAFPATDLVDYKKRTHGAPHYTVSNGVKNVQDKLVRDVQYELSTAVTAVKPEKDQVRVLWRKTNDGESILHEDLFDRVVLAVAPNIVGQVFDPLRHHMERIPTIMVESVVHSDQKALGIQEAQDVGQAQGQSQLIYLRTSVNGIHRTESLHVQPCGAIVTTCPFSPIDPSLSIQSAKFIRVLRTPQSKRIVDSMFEDTPHDVFESEKACPLWRNGDNNVWLVGGWCWDGMVLLEGCVVSAMRVANHFGVEVPWQH